MEGVVSTRPWWRRAGRSEAPPVAQAPLRGRERDEVIAARRDVGPFVDDEVREGAAEGQWVLPVQQEPPRIDAGGGGQEQRQHAGRAVAVDAAEAEARPSRLHLVNAHGRAV